PVFGCLADVDELIRALHARGMKLVIDVVVNHTSDEHPWFAESRSSTENPKRDWYWWRRAQAGMQAGAPGTEPTNWRSFFSQSAWQLDDTTGEYFLHLFSRRQPDLNWENPQVRQAVYAMLRWWLDRGVDGFRMDVINMISKRLPLQDGPPLPGRQYGDGSAGFICGPRIHEFLHELNTEVISGRDKVLITVGEMPGVTIQDAVRFTDPASAEVDMVFQFEHVELDHGPGGKFDPRPPSLLAPKASLGRRQAGLAAGGWDSPDWNNPAQPRAVSRFGSDDPAYRELSAKLLATVLHLHRGTPYVYQGEELGMTNFPFAALSDFRDVESLNYYRHAIEAGRENEEVLAALAVQEPGQCPHPDAVGRQPASRVHHRHPLARGEPELPRDQRRCAARRSRLRFQLLPAGHRAAPRAARCGAWRLHHAGTQQRAHLCVHPAAGRR